MELRGFDDGYGAQVAGWALDEKEVALLSGRVAYPFRAELRGSWRTVDADIHSYLLFDGDRPRVRPENDRAIRAYRGNGFVDVPAALMEEWNDGQPVPYRWMRCAGEQVSAGELRG